MVETILSKLAEILFEGLSGFADGCLTVLGCNLEKFEEAFPVVGLLYIVFQGFAIGFTFLIVLWQAFKTFGLPLGVEVENPVMVMLKGFIAIFCILFAKDIIINYVFPLFSPTYQTFLEINGDVQKLTFSEAMGKVDPRSLASEIVAFTASATVKTIGITICLVLLLANFLRLLLEIVERYILLGVIVYTSPLAFVTLTSLSTSTIFRNWMSMVFGQLIMLLLNVWTLKMFFSVMDSQMKHGDFFLWFFITLGFLKIAQRLDTYMQQIGVNAGTTGGALAGAILGVFSSKMITGGLKGAAKGVMKGVSGAFGGAAVGAAAGAAAKAAGVGMGAMAAVGAGGVVGSTLKAQGQGIKGGLKGIAKAAAKSKWTNVGVAGSLIAGVKATKAFQAAGNKFANTNIGKYMTGTRNIDADTNPSRFIKNARGIVDDNNAKSVFKDAFSGAENAPSFKSMRDITSVKIGNGQVTATGKFASVETGNDGKAKTVYRNATYQFSRTDKYNPPSGVQGKDWSICKDNSGISYYVTKATKDPITGKKVMNIATKK